MKLNEGERLDDLQRNQLKIIQNPSWFCFGVDSVLLSGFVRVLPGETVIDLGTGNGILPLLLSAKTEGRHFTGLELQEAQADLARRSVELNGLTERIDIRVGDLMEASKIFGRSSFDVVVSNPPYLRKGAGKGNEAVEKRLARHEEAMDLSGLLRETAALLKPGGRCYLVHRPGRMAEVLSGMRSSSLTPTKLRLVFPYADRDASLFLLESVYGSGSELSVLPPLILHAADGSYTEEIKKNYGF